MKFRVRFTEEARADLRRLYEFALQRDGGDLRVAERALRAIRQALVLLETTPFSCRKAMATDALLREIVISFGESGYVALFEITDKATVTILAVRHQREEDYH